jgi:hypothetical protein
LTPQRKKAQAEKEATDLAAAAPEAAPHSSTSSEAAKPKAGAQKGSSLYSLIKKQSQSPYAVPSPPVKAPVKKAEVVSKIKPNDVHNSFDDSFESEENFPKSTSSTDQRTSQSSLTSQSTEYRCV